MHPLPTMSPAAARHARSGCRPPPRSWDGARSSAPRRARVSPVAAAAATDTQQPAAASRSDAGGSPPAAAAAEDQRQQRQAHKPSAPPGAAPLPDLEAYLHEFALPAAHALMEPYAAVEQRLCCLITLRGLDACLMRDEAVRRAAQEVEAAVDSAALVAYAAGPNPEGAAPTPAQAQDVASAHTFLQRALYKINRLSHFWFDSPHNYVNERSPWLAALRERIEGPWQAWECATLGLPLGSVRHYRHLPPPSLKQALSDRYKEDVDPPPSPGQRYISGSMTAQGYSHLLAIGALDGLVEASRQSRVCAGVANPVSVAIFRVLMEEYGSGRLAKKHSTFYASMMREMGLSTVEEAYLDLVPWEALASANHNFLLTERRRHYLRYAGGLSFFEINGPSVYRAYLAAAQRCGLGEGASGYWALHIKEDERHGRQMLDEVALPLVDMFPNDGWEVLWGYDQERAMSARAGQAVAATIRAAERRAGLLTEEEEAEGAAA